MLFGVGHVGRQMIAGNPVVGGATLDLGFMVPGSLDPRITFARASTATYFDATGTMQSAAVNAPRWDYDPATLALRGLLIEEARTNTILQSAIANNPGGVWSNAFTAFGALVLAPDGTTTGATITGSDPTARAFQAAGPIFSTNTITGSVWLKAAAPLTARLGLGVAAIREIVTQPVSVTTAWQRFSVTATGLSTDTGNAQFSVYCSDGTSGKTINAWGAQMEVGAFPTSYIPTTAAAVTRAIDLPSIAPANMGFFVSPGGSWMTEFNCQYYQAGGTYQRVVFTATPPNGAGSIITNVGFGVQYDGTIQQTANSAPVNTVQKMASTYGASVGQLCLNGGPVFSGAMSVGYPNAVGYGVAFMCVSAGAAQNQNTIGYIRRVRYWPRALSAAELQQVTT